VRLVRFGEVVVNFDRVTVVRQFAATAGGESGPGGLVRIEFGPGHAIELAEEAGQVAAWLAATAEEPPASS